MAVDHHDDKSSSTECDATAEDKECIQCEPISANHYNGKRLGGSGYMATMPGRVTGAKQAIATNRKTTTLGCISNRCHLGTRHGRHSDHPQDFAWEDAHYEWHMRSVPRL